MKRFKSLLFTSAVAFGLVACGGGGGGGTPSDKVDSGKLEFPKTSKYADPSTQNIQKAKQVISDMLNNNFKDFFSNDTANYTDFVTLNSAQDHSCQGGGYVKYKGKDSEGYMDINFDNCRDSEGSMSGSVKIKVSEKDDQANDYKKVSIKFSTDCKVTDNSNDTITISKNSSFTYDVSEFQGSQPAKYSVTVSMIASCSSGEKFGVEDCKFYYDCKTPNIKKVYQTKGTLYIDNLNSYVKCDTSYNMSNTPFKYQVGAQGSVLIDGEGRYLMKGDAKLKVKVEAGQEKCYIDVSGDGNFQPVQ